jgi:hypothetical protein
MLSGCLSADGHERLPSPAGDAGLLLGNLLGTLCINPIRLRRLD